MIKICTGCKVMTHKDRCPLCGTTEVLSRDQLAENILNFEINPTPENAVIAAECQESLETMNDLQGELS